MAYSFAAPAWPAGSFTTGDWHGTWSPAAYAAAIGTVREAIHEGDVFVWDSEADTEIEESWVKARPLLALA